MIIVGQLLAALIGGAIASAIPHLILGWNARAWFAWFLALALVILIGLIGPIKLG